MNPAFAATQKVEDEGAFEVPQTDRGRIVELWKSGGPAVKGAAEAALLGSDNDVRVAKEGNHLMIHVVDKSGPKKSQVEVKVPMKVVEALLSAGKDELDLVAALHALGAQGDVELVSVKDSENTVKVWLDSKNVAD